MQPNLLINNYVLKTDQLWWKMQPNLLINNYVLKTDLSRLVQENKVN